MEPNSHFSDRLNDQSLPGLEDKTEIFRARHESEDRDRAIVREAVERGLPEAEIEEHVSLASDFVRLNPGQDVRAYVRRLLDEEKGDQRAQARLWSPLARACPIRPGPTPRMSQHSRNRLRWE